VNENASGYYLNRYKKYKDYSQKAKLNPQDIHTLSDFDIQYITDAANYKFPTFPVQDFLVYIKEYLALEQLKQT
jgi:hypothetical protein